jgi:O-antigen/teichoic acid export membrane protein
VNPIKIFIKSGAWLTLASIVSKLTSALSLPLLAKLLMPESIGIYRIVVSLAQSIDNFSDLGVTIAMERNGSEHKKLGVEAVGRLFGVGLAIIFLTNICMAVTIYWFREPLAQHWLRQTSVTIWLGAAAILICLQPLGKVPLTFLASLQEFRSYAIRSSIGALGSGIITVLLGWQFGLLGAIGGLIIAAFLQIIWSYTIVYPILNKRKIYLRFDKFFKEAKSIFELGFPYYCGNTLLGSLVGLPLMGLVSQYGGLKELGYLRVAQSMAALIGFIPSAIAPAAISHLSASLAEDVSSYQRLKSIYLRGNLIFLLLPTGIICLLLPQLIDLVFGHEYQQSSILSFLTLWITVVAGVASVMIQYLVVACKTKKIAQASFLGICCWVGSAYLLVPMYSGTGFLIAQLAGQLLGFIVVVRPATQDLEQKDLQLFVNLIILTIITFLWTLFFTLVKINPVINLIILILTVLLLLSFIFINTLQHSEQKQLTGLFHNKLKE